MGSASCLAPGLQHLCFWDVPPSKGPTADGRWAFPIGYAWVPRAMHWTGGGRRVGSPSPGKGWLHLLACSPLALAFGGIRDNLEFRVQHSLGGGTGFALFDVMLV